MPFLIFLGIIRLEKVHFYPLFFYSEHKIVVFTCKYKNVSKKDRKKKKKNFISLGRSNL